MNALGRRAAPLSLVRAVAVVSVAANMLSAQDSTRAHDTMYLVAASVGVPGYGHEAYPQFATVGVNFTRVSQSLVAPDFSIGTMPYALGNGVLVLGARGGLAAPIRLSPDFLVLPSTGVSFVAGVGEGGGGALVGFNAGVATMILNDDSSGIRVGMTWHKFQESREAVWLFEVGVIFPRRRSKS